MRLIWMLPVLFMACVTAQARQNAPALQTPMPGQVLATGTVPDEASKAGILQKLREVYGADRVVDQIAVGSVILPANWNNHVQKIIHPNLRSVSRGQLSIDGTTVSIRGEVHNEAQRQQIAGDMASSLNATYVVNNRLRVSASEQSLLDQALANRIVEFDSSQAVLTAAGKSVLEDMVPVLRKIADRQIEIIGHTDNSGLRASNIALSQARAETVRQYLAAKGVEPQRITASGHGPDRPVADNDTFDGRSRNRRIEFRIGR